MEKNINDYLPFYLGCEVITVGKKPGNKHYNLVGVTLDGGALFRTIPEGFSIDLGSEWKPLLRPLSDMTEEEMTAYLQILFSDVDDKIDADEFDLEMFYNDGGIMVDGDIEVGANISCRCYEGQVAIRNCGSTFLFDDSGELTRVINIPEGIRFLLSKRFDIFKLIPSGLAIDATKQLAK